MKKHFTLAPVFQDNMVFQANKPIRIFGECKKGVELTIAFLNQEVTIKTISTNFMFELEPISYRDKGFSFSLHTKRQELTIYNCLVGDVFLFVGGKNAYMPLKDSYHEADFEDNQVRLFEMNHGLDEEIKFTGEAKWKQVGYEGMENYSALTYVFTKQLRTMVKKPIGVISCAHFQTSIFSWISDMEINSHIDILRYIQETKSTGEYNQLNPSKFYQEMIMRLAPYSISAVIIYQGENDYKHADLFKISLSLLIKAYRHKFNDQKLPFVITQISGFETGVNHNSSTSMVREAQANMMSDDRNIYIATAIDLGEEDNDYLKEKLVISKRLANVVLDRLYKNAKNSIPPSYYSHSFIKDQVTIYTQHNYLNLISHSNRNLGFSYTLDGDEFIKAIDVKLMNNQIIIKGIEGAKEIRYACDNYPVCDIYTTNELPLLPFRIIL